MVTEEPKRPTPRSDIAEPSDMKSNTDKELPRRAMPNTLAELPSRRKDRRLKLLPIVAASSTDNVEPNRAMP
jgi:hypothetical protein